MAKFAEKIKAQKLRKKGDSIKNIAKKLRVSKGTASIWCRDIRLSKEQIKKLHERQIRGGYAGRLKGAQMQRDKRIERMRACEKTAGEILQNFSHREFLLTGIALYWGEGTKPSPRIRFANSDPAMIIFMMKWFRDILSISDDRFNFYVIINGIHKHRIRKIESYWAKIVCCPLSKFWSPAFVQAKSKKIYPNPKDYFGTLHIEVKRSVEEKYKILGLIKALGNSTS